MDFNPHAEPCYICGREVEDCGGCFDEQDMLNERFPDEWEFDEEEDGDDDEDIEG